MWWYSIYYFMLIVGLVGVNWLNETEARKHYAAREYLYRAGVEIKYTDEADNLFSVQNLTKWFASSATNPQFPNIPSPMSATSSNTALGGGWIDSEPKNFAPESHHHTHHTGSTVAK